ncbi:acyl-CoA-binding domain-containing protein 7-like [Contarinia nasturtii]|uniref:acyl-CoA-binding domain-containing protein 7-like n=1 Tax=Contarinia nasturtii TaxID=265458 RepID=UPI0012D405FB|nr:acyl-CoA-binding domain-containing protein 7-like [Contarinia nasturtii]XP_031635175.1 acyl-CoA-binding domain-containing protein 7-like [Contarinia nasturtii]
MGLEEDFTKAAEDVKNLKETPADGDLLELYALYKQATVGDVNTTRPGLLDFKGKAKWDAWNHKKGTDSEKAKQDYVNKAQELIEKVGLN